MSYQSDYINSLSTEELRGVLGYFLDWHCEEGCPAEQDSSYECDFTKMDEPKDLCSDEYMYECPNDSQYGCWVEYYVWKFRQKKELGDEQK